MSLSDKINAQLLSAVEELTKQIKKQKRPMAERNTAASRVSRAAKDNADKIRNSSEDLTALIDSLKGVHESAKSGSLGIGSMMKSIKKSLDPLEEAFSNLDKVVDKITHSMSKRESQYAKSMADHIKANEGNIDAMNDVMKKYAEYTAVLNELATFQNSKVRDEEAIRDALRKEIKLRRELNKSGVFGKDKNGKNNNVASEGMRKYMKFLKDQPNSRLGKEGLKSLNKELENTNKQFKAMNEVAGEFVESVDKMQKSLDDTFKKDLKRFSSELLNGLKTDLSKIPNVVQSRLQTGMMENNFIDAVRMGISPEQLNEFRAANRDVLSAMGGFKPGSNLLLDGQIRDRDRELKTLGLTGEQSTAFLTKALRASYETGRQYDAQTADRMIQDTLRVQQAFGGTAQQAADMLNDYSTQISNIEQYNKAQNQEQRNALQKELTTRMLLTKYMGYDVEYLKQQDQLRHNAQFGDIADRIRGAIMGQVSANNLQSQMGWTDEQAEVWAKSRRPGAKLSNEEMDTLMKLNSDVANYKRGYEEQASSGDLSGYIGALAPNIVNERLIAQSGGDTLQGITDSDTRAQAQRNARGDISQDDYLAAINDGAQMQRDSVTMFDNAVMEFSKTIKGMSGLPGMGTLGAIGGFAAGVAGNFILGKALKGGLGKIFGGGGGGGAGVGKILSGAGNFVKGGAKGAGSILGKAGGFVKGANIAGKAGSAAKGIGNVAGAIKNSSTVAKAVTATSGLAKGAWQKGATVAGKAGSAVKNTATSVLGKIGILGGAAGAGAALAPAAEKTVTEGVAKAAEKSVGKAAAEVGGKALGKSLLKKIPGIGLIAGLGFAAGRMSDGDALGATLEAASGITSTVPVIGTAASLGIDGLIAGRDIAKASVSEENQKWVDSAVLSLINPAAGTINLAHEALKSTLPKKSVSDAAKSMDGLNRDANGNVIEEPKQVSEEVTLLQKLVALLAEQNGLVADNNQMTADAQTNKQVAEHNRRSMQEHYDNLAQTMSGQFTMPV